MEKKIYDFGEFSLDLVENRLTRRGQAISIQPKVFDLLLYFVKNHGELISRDDLMDAVWKDTFVEETNLRYCIHALRKALGKTADGRDYIETIPKRGYRFTADVFEKLPEVISADEISNRPAQAKSSDSPLIKNKNLLIGTGIFLLICLLVIVFIWNRSKPQPAKNVIGIEQLAVLPFEPFGEKEREIQVGLADSMITNLSKIKHLKILPLSSVSKFAGQTFDGLQAGKELSADAVLTGKYRFDGDNLIVTVNLLRVADGENIWIEDFTANGKTDLERESSVALRTARLLSLKIAEAEDEQLLADQNLNKEAVQNYLAARKIWRKNELFRRDEMFDLFEKAIAAEPDWAVVFASYSEALFASEEFVEERKKIESIAERSIELNNSLPQAHAVLGESYWWFDWNWKKAEEKLKFAIELDPNYALSHYKYARLLIIQRRFAEAEIELNKAIEIEPFSPLFHSGLCELYSSDKKIDKAISACLYAKQLEPTHWQIKKLLFWLYVKKEMYAEMDEMYLGKLSPAEREKNPLAIAVAKKDFRSYWDYQINFPVTNGNEQMVGLSMFYVQIGDKEKALDYLEKGFEKRDLALPFVNSDFNFDPIRQEKRLVALMQKIGLQK